MTISVTVSSGYDASISATLASGYNASFTVAELTEADQWVDVAQPDTEFSWVPFTIEEYLYSSRFRAASFDIRTRAGVTVAKTYYLNTVTGNNSNSGLTSALPKKTWNGIMIMGDYDRVIIQDGSELTRSVSNTKPTRDVEVIGEGTVKWTSRHTPGAWSKTGGATNVYEASFGGEFIQNVSDSGTLDIYGYPVLYESVDSVAECDALAGSYYWTSGALYVHLLDHSDPTGNDSIKYYDTFSIYWTDDKIKYIENIDFEGGIDIRNGSSAGGCKAYFKDCDWWSLEVHGAEEIIVEDCTGHSTSDVVNYKVLNTVVSKGIEIDCDFGKNTVYGGPTSQASTGHDNSRIVRIGGRYYLTAGQSIADVSGTWSWNLGCSLENGTTGFYLGNTGNKSWLHGVTIAEPTTYGIEVEAGATVYTKSITNPYTNGGAGTVSTY